MHAGYGRRRRHQKRRQKLAAQLERERQQNQELPRATTAVVQNIVAAYNAYEAARRRGELGA